MGALPQYSGGVIHTPIHTPTWLEYWTHCRIRRAHSHCHSHLLFGTGNVPYPSSHLVFRPLSIHAGPIHTCSI